MGNTQPVSASTILTPSKNWVSSSGFGYAAVKVLDSNAAPVKGTTVTLTKSGSSTLTDTTADDGCAVFQTSTVGTWTATINNAGYVDFYGNQSATKNVTIAVGGALPGDHQLRQGRDRDGRPADPGRLQPADLAAVADVREHRAAAHRHPVRAGHRQRHDGDQPVAVLGRLHDVGGPVQPGRPGRVRRVPGARRS